jgi:predicted PurR-regulated permease PerM
VSATVQPAPLLRTTLLGAGIVIIAAGLHAAAASVNIVLVSFLLAMTVYPISYLLGRRGVPRGLAVMLTVAIVLVGGILVIGALAASLTRMADKLPEYEAGLSALLGSLKERLAARGIVVSDVLQPDSQRIVGVVGRLARGALSGLGYGFLTLILVALILVEMPMRPLAEGTDPRSFAARYDAVAVRVRRFVGLQGLIGAVQAAVNAVVMIAVGTDFPMVWAVLFFLLNFVPFGFLLALVPPVVLTLLEHGAGRGAVLFVILFAANLVADNVVKPKVMGEGLGISPLVIILSFMFWAYVLGPMGAILAIPLTITLHEVLPVLTRTEAA